MDTINVFLKVAKLANKGQNERYEVRKMTKFTNVSELKMFILTNYIYENEIHPANDISFRMGLFGEGRAKCDIKNEKQLQDAENSVKKGTKKLISAALE